MKTLLDNIETLLKDQLYLYAYDILDYSGCYYESDTPSIQVSEVISKVMYILRNNEDILHK